MNCGRSTNLAVKTINREGSGKLFGSTPLRCSSYRTPLDLATDERTDGRQSVTLKNVQKYENKYSTSTPIIPDKKFPLPGNIGIAPNLFDSNAEPTPSLTSAAGGLWDDAQEFAFSNRIEYKESDFARVRNIEKFVNQYNQRPRLYSEADMNAMLGIDEAPEEPPINLADKLVSEPTGELAALISGIPTPVAATIHVCPEFVKRQLAPLFPQNESIASGKILLMNLTHKTEHDMSCWSLDMELERQKLIENFMQTAQRICELLKANNFFADFIDPVNGKPFYSAHTNSSLFETDELYEKFGFRIEDLGCCKVVHHKAFGTNVFVGSIITDAPGYTSFLKQFFVEPKANNKHA